MTAIAPLAHVYMGLSAPGMGEWAVILILVLVLFGGKNIPDLARALGKGIREFKRAANAIGEDVDDAKSVPPSPRASDAEKSPPPPRTDP